MTLQVEATAHEMLAKVNIVPVWNSGNFRGWFT